MFGPARDWGPEDRSGIDAEIPSPADIERTEPKHTLKGRASPGKREVPDSEHPYDVNRAREECRCSPAAQGERGSPKAAWRDRGAKKRHGRPAEIVGGREKPRAHAARGTWRGRLRAGGDRAASEVHTLKAHTMWSRLRKAQIQSALFGGAEKRSKAASATTRPHTRTPRERGGP